MLSPDAHDPFNSLRDKYDFIVVLTTLRGGYAGTTQKQRLYFNFPETRDDSTSYFTFLARLQEATQLSVIPPLEPGEPYRPSLGPADETETRHNHDEDTGSPVNALGIMLPTPPDSFTTASAPLQPKRDEEGYTVKDGAWIYTSKLYQRVVEGKLGLEKDKKVTDKSSYDNMLLVLKSQKVTALNKEKGRVAVKPPQGTLIVEITHVRNPVELWAQYTNIGSPWTPQPSRDGPRTKKQKQRKKNDSAANSRHKVSRMMILGNPSEPT